MNTVAERRRELLEQLFTESHNADEFERKLEKACFPFISSDDTPDVVQAFRDKYPFSGGNRAHLGGIPGGRDKAWFVYTGLPEQKATVVEFKRKLADSGP
jgi:hypothetical protein